MNQRFNKFVFCNSFAAAAVASLVSLAAAGGPGAVYTMNNSPDGNAVLAYHRAPDGTLTTDGIYETGGLGTGEGLGNQGGLTLSANHHWLFAVNAGSNEVSAFRVTPQGLVLTDVEPSLGEFPVSVATYDNLLYVLNAGGSGGIQGFTFDDEGDLSPIADSMRSLSGAEETGAAQVSFSPDGGLLVVTEKATSMIDTFVVQDDGTTMGPNVFASSGQTPFGFDITSNGFLLVSEAFGGEDDLAAASSYALYEDGSLELISGTVRSFQTAACWLVVNNNNRFAYTTNTPSGTLSGYTVNTETGELTLLDDDGVTFDTGEGTRPLDAAFSTNGRFLYVLHAGTHEIGVYQASKGKGGLALVQIVPDLPETANGMAAH